MNIFSRMLALVHKIILSCLILFGRAGWQWGAVAERRKVGSTKGANRVKEQDITKQNCADLSRYLEDRTQESRKSAAKTYDKMKTLFGINSLFLTALLFWLKQGETHFFMHLAFFWIVCSLFMFVEFLNVEIGMYPELDARYLHSIRPFGRTKQYILDLEESLRFNEEKRNFGVDIYIAARSFFMYTLFSIVILYVRMVSAPVEPGENKTDVGIDNSCSTAVSRIESSIKHASSIEKTAAVGEHQGGVRLGAELSAGSLERSPEQWELGCFEGSLCGEESPVTNENIP